MLSLIEIQAMQYNRDLADATEAQFELASALQFAGLGAHPSDKLRPAPLYIRQAIELTSDSELFTKVISILNTGRARNAN